MPKWLLILSISVLSFFASADKLEAQDEKAPPAAVYNVTTDDAMDHLYGLDPLVYIIVVGLVAAVGALTLTVRVLWYKNVELNETKDELQDSRVKISLSTTEAIAEAINLVQSIHDGVDKLHDNEATRRLLDVELKTYLINITKDLEIIRGEVNRK